MKRFDNVVIWGHKQLGWPLQRFSHTHSYIHQGFHRAFSQMGYRALWADSPSEVIGLDPKKTLFLTEDQVDHNIPLWDGASYVTHSSSKEVYEERGLDRLHLCVLTVKEKSRLAQVPGTTVLDEVSIHDPSENSLFQPWATNVLRIEDAPDLIGKMNSNVVHYVGTVTHDNLSPRFKELSQSLKANGFKFRALQGVPEAKVPQLLSSQEFSFDLRGDWHREVGYIPCRIWKNLSYGLIVGSNSTLLSEVFGSRVEFNSSIPDLVDQVLQLSSRANKALREESKHWVVKNHSYISRASNILRVLS